MSAGTRIRWVSQLQDTQLPGEPEHERQFGGVLLCWRRAHPEQCDLGARRTEPLRRLQAAAVAAENKRVIIKGGRYEAEEDS